MQAERSPDYRADIDGLRAVAVLAVLGFHAFAPWVPGGFVGVDVFFVVSGFLITGIVFNELEAGSFRLSSFYARRARRILPALVVVIAVVYGAGWAVLLRSELEELERHVLGAALFASNFLLWSETGYFDTAAEVKPLLHLWSLGIEEQFYLVWPLLLAALRRWRLLWATLALMAMSLAWNAVTVLTEPAAAFYLPHQRVWELLVGALLALVVRRHGASTPVRSPALLSALGLLLIATSVVGIDAHQRFPGLAAVPAVLGTALVILAGSQAWPNRRMLSAPGLVWIGLISYPLYLWHWPLLSFARILEGREPDITNRIALIASAFVLASLTYRFVEMPFRYGRLRAQSVRLPLRAMALAGALGLTAFDGDGMLMPAHGVTGEPGQRRFHEFVEKTFHPCADPTLAAEAPKWRGYVRCRQSKPGTQVDVALVGDSHAEHLFPGLASALPGLNVAYYLRSPEGALDPRIVDNPSVRTIVLAFRGARPWGHLQPRLPGDVARLTAAGKRVYAADDVPTLDHPVEACVRHASLCTFDRDARERRAVVEMLDSISRDAPALKRIDVWRHACPEGRCQAAHEGVLLYRDDHHLGVSGSRYIGARIVSQVPEIREARQAAGKGNPFESRLPKDNGLASPLSR
jgi:peptidoglycan/LPS O-acetylase OafA/YrhL